MLKTFTLNKREYIQLTGTKGKVIFHLTDEIGHERVISGETYINNEQFPQGVSSNNKRELPLIEGLFRLVLNESIEIEFDAYNKVYNRTLDKTINQVAYDKVMVMQKENSLSYRMSHFFMKDRKAA